MKRLVQIAVCVFTMSSSLLAAVALRIETPSAALNVSLSDLEKKLKPQTVTVVNPEDHRTRSYQGFWLEDIFAVLQFPSSEPYFICSDGYTSPLPKNRIGHHQWLLAFGEASGGWTPMIHKGETVSPAPWYLVGVTPESYAEFPWPFQIVAIRSYAPW